MVLVEIWSTENSGFAFKTFDYRGEALKFCELLPIKAKTLKAKIVRVTQKGDNDE